MPAFSRRKLIAAASATCGLGTAAATLAKGSDALCAMGSAPKDKRLDRIQTSRNFANGKFHNLYPVVDRIDTDRTLSMLGFLFEDQSAQRPPRPIPSVKTNPASIADGNLVWFGHSGFFLKMAGLSIAVDPALHACFPLGGFFKPFPGADIYTPQDIPALDVLIFTHDHYDHLDMITVREVLPRTARVICPLGVGAHLEHWGCEAEKIIELDWGETTSLGKSVRLTCTPAQHFSGRTFKRNLTLWSGFVLEADGYTLYISGDGGPGAHFAQIASAFPKIDLAIVEDGQYNPDWAGIHLLPADWKRTVATLAPRFVMPCHNSKYDLSRHTWTDPLEQALAASRELNVALATPRIGNCVSLDNPAVAANLWWREIV